MERMETELFEAATHGRVDSLQKLLTEDPIILDRVTVNCLSETPLHVAALLGHIDFVREMIRIKPQLATELNSSRSSPLHLASAKGHVGIVRILLSAYPQACLDHDRNGLTPLHLAAVKGRVEVMKELLQAKPDAAPVMVYQRENVLHLCVKYYQLDALKLLVEMIGEPEFINSKDSDGNTILHLAVAEKQVETIKFLVTVAEIEVNALNFNGMTAVDILSRSRRDVRNSEMEESLRSAGGFGTTEGNAPLYIDNRNSKMNNCSVKRQDDWLEKKRSALMVVASLIATMAFQVGVNPPSGIWQDDKLFDSQGNPVPDPHLAGRSVMARNYPGRYEIFSIINTTGFVASLSIIMLLMSGLPLRRRFFIWILVVITWIAITSISLVYIFSISVLTIANGGDSTSYVIGISVVVWLCLMALLLISHTIRLVVATVKNLRKLSRRRRRSIVLGSPVLVNNASV